MPPATVLTMTYPSQPQFIEAFPTSDVGWVEVTITPKRAGRVHFQATSWPARLHPQHPQTILQPGDRVEVLDRDGITLWVIPA